MAEDDRIRYSDIIQPDDSIERLIKQIEELNQHYGVVVDSIKTGSERIAKALKTASGATAEGRRSIDEAAASASRLERAQRELEFALTDTGKQVAWLKAQTIDTNRATVQQQRQLQAIVSSYDRLKADLKEATSLYKSLTAAERADAAMGQQLLNDIVNLKTQIQALNQAMRPQIQTLTELEKAQKRLAFLQSAEGQQLLRTKAQISEITNAYRQQDATIDPLVQARERLAQATSSENEQLQRYRMLTNETNRIAKLTAQINISAEGSYNRLAAQYELNKIKLNAMSGAEREATNAGKRLEEETKAIYDQMIRLQEATGKHTLSVGNYKRVWDGLGFSITQVVRELPAAAVSANTFFLAISNNLPMVVDEIKKFRQEGATIPQTIAKITRSIFSWNTALVLILTAFSMFGRDILDWIGNLFKSEDALTSMLDALEAIDKELENSSGGYGDKVTSLKKLQEEWKSLRTEAEKKQWIIDNKSEFDKLDVSVRSIAEADNLFITNTEAVIKALQFRAKATAAAKIASEKYEKALLKQNELELEKEKGPSTSDKVFSVLGNIVAGQQGLSDDMRRELMAGTTAAKNRQNRLDAIEKEMKDLEGEGDAFFEFYKTNEQMARKVLKDAGIEEAHKNGGNGGGGGPEDKDLTDIIHRMSLSVQKKYEESLTALEEDEFDKRKKAATDAAQAKIRALEETYRKNVDYLEDTENKYKDLTDEEKRIVEESQKKITDTIKNTQEKLSDDLARIEIERQIAELETVEETIKLRLKAVKAGSEEEFKLRKQAIDTATKIAKLENSLLPDSKRQSPFLIQGAADKESTDLTKKYLDEQLEAWLAHGKAKFEATEHNEKQITLSQLREERIRLNHARLMHEAGIHVLSPEELGKLNEEIRKNEKEIKDLNFIARVGKRGLQEGLLEGLGFNEKQISAFGEFTDKTLDHISDIIDAEIKLAEQALETANARVEAAQKAYEAEVEANENGYASNVQAAKKELDQARKNAADKNKILEDAQRKQRAIDAATQASSLVTASAEIWSAFGAVPPVAIAMIASMWASFAVSKIKARQVAGLETQEYGEGGLEFLEGGSHASGNDIELGTKNRRGKRMKAEGGEALAIINKRNTRKYRKVLPEVIESFNKGNFEEKYLNAFRDNSQMYFNVNSSIDLSNLERNVEGIREQNATKYYTMADGSTVICRRNMKRVIKS